MKVRSLVVAFATAAAASGFLATTATPAHAGNACPSSDTLSGTVTGTVTAADPDWWALSSSTYQTVTLVPTNGGDADLYVRDATCGTLVCSSTRASGLADSCTLPAGSYNVGVLYYSGPGAMVTYTLSATTPACSDGVDNDGDNRVDHPNDYGCASPGDNSEGGDPACGDGLDNDGDGKRDYPADGGCASPYDTSEGVPCSSSYLSVGATVCAGYSTGDLFAEVEVLAPGVTPGPEYRVAGYLDMYRFTIAGQVVTLPCVVLLADNGMSNPCASLGGELVRRDRTLVDRTVSTYRPTIDEITLVRICKAELQLTVDGYGVPSAAAYAVC